MGAVVSDRSRTLSRGGKRARARESRFTNSHLVSHSPVVAEKGDSRREKRDVTFSFTYVASRRDTATGRLLDADLAER